MNKALWESLKEVGRYVVCGVASLLLTMAIDAIPNLKLSGEVQTILFSVFTMIGRWLDKFKYENSKEKEKTGLYAVASKGLIPF